MLKRNWKLLAITLFIAVIVLILLLIPGKAKSQDLCSCRIPAQTVICECPTTPTPTGTPTATTTPTATATPGTITINPVHIDDLISNPGIGFETTDKAYNQLPSGHINVPSASSYQKFYWSELEPTNNNFNWSKFDSAVANVKTSKQKLAFRIMVSDPETSGPSWLRTLAGGGWTYTYEGSAVRWTPSWDNTQVQAQHKALLQAIYDRYNSQNIFYAVDIGSVGMWGEWHYGDTKIVTGGSVGQWVPLPSLNGKKAVVDQYFSVFPNTPKIAQLTDIASLQYAVTKGAGFRGDCWGNINYQNKPSGGLYDTNINAVGAQDQWKIAPVYMETCWDINYWVSHGFDLNYIFNWALSRHVSAVNPKTWNYPATTEAKIKSFLRTLGYRFYLTELTYPGSAQGTATIAVKYVNEGSAPNYRDFKLNLALKNSSNTFYFPIDTLVKVLPGSYALTKTLDISALNAGTYAVFFELTDLDGKDIKLANAGVNSEGLYPAGSLIVN